MPVVLLRREDMERCTQRKRPCEGAGHIAGMHLQARRCRGFLATTRHWKRGMARFLPQRNQHCHHLDFRPLASFFHQCDGTFLSFCAIKHRAAPGHRHMGEGTERCRAFTTQPGRAGIRTAEVGQDAWVAKGTRRFRCDPESGSSARHSGSMCKARQGVHSALKL